MCVGSLELVALRVRSLAGVVGGTQPEAVDAVLVQLGDFVRHAGSAVNGLEPMETIKKGEKHRQLVNRKKRILNTNPPCKNGFKSRSNSLLRLDFQVQSIKSTYLKIEQS